MRLGSGFFSRDALDVAPELLGKALVRSYPDGSERRLLITETEVYRGEEDTACHAHRGRTKRTEMLYRPGGAVYVYLCYGIHWLLNVITGPEDFPQGVLIRACLGFEGPESSQRGWTSRASSTAPTLPPPACCALRTRGERFA